jgi:adenosyl cobinamide kinase/adenosyl cobinamide phosphate guanylyltransferase
MTVLIIGGAYQNKKQIAQTRYPELPKQYDLHLLVRQTLAQGRDPMTLLPDLRGKCITCDEVGCGLVPMVQEEEQWREYTGRLCCAIAEEADQVLRVIAGFPQFIKGKEEAL